MSNPLTWTTKDDIRTNSTDNVHNRSGKSRPDRKVRFPILEKHA